MRIIRPVEAAEVLDEPEVLDGMDAAGNEHALRGREVLRVHDEELVLVERYPHVAPHIENFDTRPAVGEEKLLEVQERALEDNSVDGFAVEVPAISAVARAAADVRLDDEAHGRSEMIEEISKGRKELPFRYGGGDAGRAPLPLDVLASFVPVALL